MSVLVTGGAGFIGSHTCDALLARGDEVVCVDNFNDYYDPEVKKANIAGCIEHQGFRFYTADILNQETLQQICLENDIGGIIHLAARAGISPSLDDPNIYHEVNIRGTLNILELARQREIQNLVFGSSSSVYGGNTKVPFAETDKTDRPISPYAATKKAGELLCHTYHHLYGIDISCLRFFTVYGPRGRPDMAPYIFTRAIAEGSTISRFGDGTSSRDYTYIDDIVAGVIAALDADHDFEIFNLGNSEPVELNEFIRVIEEVVGRDARIRQLPEQPGDVSITYADITKAKEMLGYDPQTGIKEGMQRFYDWYKETQG